MASTWGKRRAARDTRSRQFPARHRPALRQLSVCCAGLALRLSGTYFCRGLLSILNAPAQPFCAGEAARLLPV
jgi:hypothetical protein